MKDCIAGILTATLILFFNHSLVSAQLCGGTYYTACISCAASSRAATSCTTTEKTKIVNYVMPYYKNAFTSLGLTAPAWTTGSNRRGRRLSSPINEIDVLINEDPTLVDEELDRRQLALPKCSDLCKVNPSYCMYYSCSGRRRSLLENEVTNSSNTPTAMSATSTSTTSTTMTSPSLGEIHEKMIMAGELTSEQEQALLPDAMYANVTSPRKLVNCATLQNDLSTLLIQASYQGYNDAYNKGGLSSTCKPTVWDTTCSIVVVAIYPYTTGCCSQDYKTCTTTCGVSQAICGSCNPTGGYVWLANGAVSGTCSPRWNGCSKSTPCCNGLICKYVDQYFSQCTALSDL